MDLPQRLWPFGIRLLFSALLLFFSASCLYHASQPARPTPSLSSLKTSLPTQSPQSLLARLPLRFEVNQGQSSAPVDFLARGPNYALFLTPAEAVFAYPDHPAVRMQLVGAARHA